MSGLRTGELAAAGGVNVQTLRYYERRGLLPEPERSPGGHRVYPPEALERLRIIKGAQRLGFTLAEVAALLNHAQPRSAPSRPSLGSGEPDGAVLGGAGLGGPVPEQPDLGRPRTGSPGFDRSGTDKFELSRLGSDQLGSDQVGHSHPAPIPPRPTGAGPASRRASQSLATQARAKLAEIETQIAQLHFIADALRAAVTAGCDDLAACATDERCPLPFPLSADAGWPVG